MENHILKDIHGNTVYVSDDEIKHKVINSPKYTLFGMDHSSINALRKEYVKRGGPLPVTVDRVEMVFHKPSNTFKIPMETVKGREPAPPQYPQSRRRIMDKAPKNALHVKPDESLSEAMCRDLGGVNYKEPEPNYVVTIDDGHREVPLEEWMVGIKEKTTAEYAEKEFYRVNRMPPVYAGWTNPKFQSSQSLDGKNVEIKKEKVPLTIKVTVDNFLIDAKYKARKLKLELALAEKNLMQASVIVKAYKMVNDPKLHALQKIGIIAGLASGLSGINLAKFAINAKINQLDKEK